VLDPALLRPGRFDRQVVVPNPDIVGTREHPQGPRAQSSARARDVNLKTVAAVRPAFPAPISPTSSTKLP